MNPRHVLDETVRELLRPELYELDRLAGLVGRLVAEVDELRLRVNVLEAQAGVPTGLPRGARARQLEVVRLLTAAGVRAITFHGLRHTW